MTPVEHRAVVSRRWASMLARQSFVGNGDDGNNAEMRPSESSADVTVSGAVADGRSSAVETAGRTHPHEAGRPRRAEFFAPPLAQWRRRLPKARSQRFKWACATDVVISAAPSRSVVKGHAGG